MTTSAMAFLDGWLVVWLFASDSEIECEMLWG